MTNSVRTSLSCITALAALVVTPLSASAHPVVDEGRRLVGEASFTEALAAFERAEAGGGLTRDDVIALFEGRALVHFAQSDATALRGDLEALAALAGARPPARDFPPDLVRALAEAVRASRGPLGIRASATRRGELVHVEAVVENAPPSLAVRVRIGARVASGELSVHDGAVRDVGAPGGARVELYAELVGPGGAVVASDGSAAAPRVVESEGAEGGGRPIHPDVSSERAAGAGDVHVSPSGERGAEDPLAPERAAPREDDEGTPVWPFVLGGGVLLAGAIVAIVLALTLPGSSTSLSDPILPSGLP